VIEYAMPELGTLNSKINTSKPLHLVITDFVLHQAVSKLFSEIPR